MAHANSSIFFAGFNEIFFRNLGNRCEGPGAHVVEGLGEVHHKPVDPKKIFFLLKFFMSKWEIWYNRWKTVGVLGYLFSLLFGQKWSKRSKMAQNEQFKQLCDHIWPSRLPPGQLKKNYNYYLTYSKAISVEKSELGPNGEIALFSYRPWGLKLAQRVLLCSVGLLMIH